MGALLTWLQVSARRHLDRPQNLNLHNLEWACRMTHLHGFEHASIFVAHNVRSIYNSLALTGPPVVFSIGVHCSGHCFRRLQSKGKWAAL